MGSISNQLTGASFRIFLSNIHLLLIRENWHWSPGKLWAADSVLEYVSRPCALRVPFVEQMKYARNRNLTQRMQATVLNVVTVGNGNAMPCHAYEDINSLPIPLGMSKKIAIANISKVLKLLKCEYPLICFSLLHDLINHSCLSYRFEFRG